MRLFITFYLYAIITTPRHAHLGMCAIARPDDHPHTPYLAAEHHARSLNDFGDYAGADCLTPLAERKAKPLLHDS